MTLWPHLGSNTAYPYDVIANRSLPFFIEKRGIARSKVGLWSLSGCSKRGKNLVFSASLAHCNHRGQQSESGETGKNIESLVSY